VRFHSFSIRNVRKVLSFKRGQTIVEVLVALSVGMLVLTAMTAAVLSSLVNTQVARSQNVANQYAQEAMEIIRASRTSAPGTYCLDQGETLLSIPEGSCPVPNIIDNQTKYIRSVQVIANGCQTNVNKVIATVSWGDGKCAGSTFCHKVRLDSCASVETVIGAGLTATPTPTPTSTIPTPTSTPIPPTPTNTPTPTPAPLASGAHANASCNCSTSLSRSQTVYGTNTLLLVTMTHATNANPSSVTYGGTNLILLKYNTQTTARSEIWYLKDAPIGTNTVTVNFSNLKISAASVSLSGVDLASPFGIAQNGSASSSTMTTASIATNATDLIIAAGGLQYTYVVTQGLGQTFIDGTNLNQTHFLSSKPGTGGSTTMSVSWTGGGIGSIIGVPVHKAP
jgi:hypothetical protein